MRRPWTATGVKIAGRRFRSASRQSLSAAVANLRRRFKPTWIAALRLSGGSVVLCPLGERRLLVLICGEVFTATPVAPEASADETLRD